MIRLQIQVDSKGKGRFIYQQIYRQIKEQILSHQVRAHHKLPPKRELAKSLAVSTNSVATAYDQLLAEGYIYTIERLGYFVEEIQRFDINDQITPSFPEILREEESSREGWISLSHMNANPKLFPFRKWLNCQAKIYEEHMDELSEMPHTQGPYILRKNIANFIYATRGVKCEPEQIIIHATSQGLMERLLMLQTTKTAFAVENPGYARYYQLLQRHQFKTHLIPLDDHGIDVKYIEQTNAQFVITTPSHQFPTGTIMPISRRVELLNWASRDEQRYIIEDDYDSEFKYQTDNVPSLQSLDYNRKVIYMGTFSKTLLPGMRISYMVLPTKLLAAYQEAFPLEIQPANNLALYTLNEFIESGQYEKHIRKMTKHYEEIRTALIEALSNNLTRDLVIYDIPAGLHFLIEVPTSKSYEEIEQAAQQEKLELYTLKRFSLNPLPLIQRNRLLVIGFANIQMEEVDEAIQRLARCI